MFAHSFPLPLTVFKTAWPVIASFDSCGEAGDRQVHLPAKAELEQSLPSQRLSAKAPRYLPALYWSHFMGEETEAQGGWTACPWVHDWQEDSQIIPFALPPPCRSSRWAERWPCLTWSGLQRRRALAGDERTAHVHLEHAVGQVCWAWGRRRGQGYRDQSVRSCPGLKWDTDF